MFYHSPNQNEVDHAADVLEMDESERTKMHAFYHRERVQNREANIKLLKALARFAGKAILLFLVSYAFWSVWTERLPK